MSGGKSSTPTVATYYFGEHQILCHGPIDNITEVRSDERIAWTGTWSGGEFVVDAPDLYGGTTREGGIVGTFELLMGSPAQAVNDYLTYLYGESIPAYRGVVSMVLKQVYRGLNYYIKPISYRATRTQVRRSGIGQWQPGYSKVPSEPVYSYISNLPPLLALWTLGTTTAEVVFSSNHSLVNGDYITVTGATDSLYNGVYPITVASATVVEYIMSGIPAGTATGPINISKGAAAPLDAGLINAVHVLRECYTDPVLGYGFSEGDIDETSWLAAAKRCYSERLGFSWVWESGSLADFVSNVLDHIQGNIYQDHKTGKIKINLLRKLTTTTGLITLDDTNSNKIKDFHKKSLGTLVSSVTVSYLDNITWKTSSSPPAIDISLANRQPIPIEKTVTYDGVRTSEVAQKLALRDLQQLSLPLYSFSIETNRVTENLNIGDAFLVNRPDYLANTLVMRVVNINLGSLTANTINIDCIEDSFAAADTVYINPISSSWDTPVTTPIDTSYRILNEVPYYLVATLKGDAYAQGSVDTTQSYIVQAAASPTPDSIQANLWTDAGAGYAVRSVLDFCFTATLLTDINKVATSLTLTNVIDIELLNVNHFIQIGTELIGLTARIGNVCTIMRGVLDTVPAYHSAGERLYGWHDYSASDEIPYLVGEVVNTKITPITGAGALDLASASVNTITIEGRMHKPYPPGNVKINNVSWPIYSTLSSLVITWASRNRLQQTTGLIDYYTGSITSEVGVGVSGILTRTDTNAVLDDFHLITALTYTLNTGGYIGLVKLDMWSFRTPYQSFQHVIQIFTLVDWDTLPTWDSWTGWDTW